MDGGVGISNFEGVTRSRGKVMSQVEFWVIHPQVEDFPLSTSPGYKWGKDTRITHYPTKQGHIPKERMAKIILVYVRVEDNKARL